MERSRGLLGAGVIASIALAACGTLDVPPQAAPDPSAASQASQPGGPGQTAEATRPGYRRKVAP